MTYAGYPVLHRYLHHTSPSLTKSFPIEGILSRKYDPRFVPANIKTGLTIGEIIYFYFNIYKRILTSFFLGMAMTEKQGGSDVRANTTKAYCDNADEKRYILIGHK